MRSYRLGLIDYVWYVAENGASENITISMENVAFPCWLFAITSLEYYYFALFSWITFCHIMILAFFPTYFASSVTQPGGGSLRKYYGKMKHPQEARQNSLSSSPMTAVHPH